MTGYGVQHYSRRHHEHLTRGWILWVHSHSKAARRAAKKRARRWTVEEM